MPSPFDGLHAIGVDETSHRKGHTCITVVVDHEQHESIKVVTGDGARWIDSRVAEHCPNAERVSERLPHRQLDERRARQGPQTPVEPDAARRR
ncbi:transposase [Bifidobacterium pseudocatenulatum]|uniref:transposase n=2 Tax=Bifidobacterium pseudocatenulatum TaxID=28026 RepID=UPI00321A2534